jgi:hypothetical protein
VSERKKEKKKRKKEKKKKRKKERKKEVSVHPLLAKLSTYTLSFASVWLL